MKTFDVIIQGAGASGLWCAMTAAQRGLSVCIVDHSAKAGKKIRIAGGGKGNLTNLELSPAHYISRNPHFCKSALARLTQWDVITFLAAHNIPWEERDHGQLFCTTSAAAMVAALIEECARHNVAILLNRTLSSTSRKGNDFTVVTDKETLRSALLVIALGGPAWPQAGATDKGYHIAREFGHTIIPPYPALAPLVMPPNENIRHNKKGVVQPDNHVWLFHGLQGVTLPASITVGSARYTENLLFTHNGISGPVTLQASCHWQQGLPVTIDFLPAQSMKDKLTAANPKVLLKTLLTRLFPARFAERLLPEALQHKQIAQLSKKEEIQIAERVHEYTVTPQRTGGFKKAEATGGGVDTASVSSKTMESKLVSGLYFTGEVLDVTGELGGFNLHWAWASGHACGKSLPCHDKE